MRQISILALCACAHASAAVIPFVEASSPPGLAPGLEAYDVRVNVPDGDNLLRFTIVGSMASGAFVDPDPVQRIFAPGGLLADSWFTAINAAPNPLPPGGSFGNPTETVAIVITPTSVSGGLLAFGPTQAPGTYIIGRFLVTEGSVFDLRVGISSQQQPVVQAFDFRVPSAGALPLLACVGAVGVARRRRR